MESEFYYNSEALIRHMDGEEKALQIARQLRLEMDFLMKYREMDTATTYRKCDEITENLYNYATRTRDGSIEIQNMMAALIQKVEGIVEDSTYEAKRKLTNLTE